MTIQTLEQELLKLSPVEKLRIIQLLLQSLSSLWSTMTSPAIAQPQANAPSPINSLNRLATLNACQTIEDPQAWQRTQRQDRALPGREV